MNRRVVITFLGEPEWFIMPIHGLQLVRSRADVMLILRGEPAIADDIAAAVVAEAREKIPEGKLTLAGALREILL